MEGERDVGSTLRHEAAPDEANGVEEAFGETCGCGASAHGLPDDPSRRIPPTHRIGVPPGLRKKRSAPRAPLFLPKWLESGELGREPLRPDFPEFPDLIRTIVALYQ